MRLFAILRLRLRSLLFRDRVEQELDEELHYHLEREIDERVVSGITHEEARYAALQSIKDIEQRKEECRDMRGLNLFDHALQDLRYALRGLRREPEFALACIVSLALAIAMATAVFSGVNGVLLRPLNLPDPDRLALLWGVEQSGDTRAVVSFADFEDWRLRSHAFAAAAAYNSYYKPVLTGGGHAERLSGLRVSHEYFKVLEVHPALGRFFRPEEDLDGRDDVVVLSNSLWRERFEANPAIVGRRIPLDGRPMTVVGVAGADLKALPRSLGGQSPQIYRPVGELPGEKSRDGRHLQTIVRLEPGVTIPEAQAELNVLCRDMARLHPDTDAKLAVRVVAIKNDLARNLRGGLIGLQMAVLAVLLIACANIANLLLARLSRRRREIAIRVALGAGMPRLARMFLAESLFVSVTGGIIGIALAFWSSDVLRIASAKVFPDPVDFSIDLRVLAFGALLSLTTTVIFGMAPILQILAARVEEALKDGGRGVDGNRRQMLRSLLAAGQIAIALALSISAGLLTRSFLHLRAVNPGFDPHGVLTAGVTLPRVRYPSDASRAEFFQRLISTLRTLPGVTHAALVTPLPMSGDFDTTGIEILGRKMVPAGVQDGPDRYIVSPDYFATVKIPLLEGRLFDERDNENHKYVALISRTAARRLWPGESPIGKKFRAGAASVDFDHSPFREIVGVVGDVAQYGLGLPPRPQIYMPHAQYADGYVTLLVRAKGDPLALAEPLRRAVLDADKEQPIYDVIPFESLVHDSIAARRFAIWVLGAFTLGALALAASGIYGVLSYTVAQRTSEFGIRMAVGARPRDVLRAAIAKGIQMILAGLISGLALALAATKFLHSFLFGIRALDFASFAGMVTAMSIVAFFACYLPARRAAKVDPLIALRTE